MMPLPASRNKLFPIVCVCACVCVCVCVCWCTRYTLLINPVLGGQLAWAYVACRALYYPLYKTPLLKVALSTAPNYCVIGYFTGCLGMLAYGLF